jgi:hypothetical protein
MGALDGDLAAERAAALARNEEYAEALALDIAWDSAAPLPHLLCAEGMAFVLFYLRRPGSGAPSGQSLPVSARDQGGLGVIEFTEVRLVKFGGPNDEGLYRHRLYGKGLDFYAAHQVVGSTWAADNGLRPGGASHYVLTFQDSTLECLAGGMRTERAHASMAEALAALASRLAELAR